MKIQIIRLFINGQMIMTEIHAIHISEIFVPKIVRVLSVGMFENLILTVLEI